MKASLYDCPRKVATALKEPVMAPPLPWPWRLTASMPPFSSRAGGLCELCEVWLGAKSLPACAGLPLLPPAEKVPS